MADKKLIDLPLVTAQETDEIYAVRNGETDVRVKLGDVMLEKVLKPDNVLPINLATDVELVPTLVGSGYAPIYSGDLRLERQFQITTYDDIDFANPVYTDSVNADSIVVGMVLESGVNYIWRC